MNVSALLGALLLLTVRSMAAGDTLSIYFRFNESTLPDEMQRRLDSALLHGPLNRSGTLLIIGHTDAIGQDGYNLGLSRKRALAVKQFLTGTGVPENDIRLITGVGEREAGTAVDPDSRPQDRRVDLVFAATQRIARIAPAPQRFEASGTAAISGPRRDSISAVADLRPGESLVLRNVYFYPGRHLVRPESYPELERLFNTLLANPKLSIRIEGHVCCINPNEPDALDEGTMKQELSANRAKAIRTLLIGRGIEAGRIEAVGFGYRYPIVRNEQNEEDANRNRRVEVRVIGL